MTRNDRRLVYALLAFVMEIGMCAVAGEGTWKRVGDQGALYLGTMGPRGRGGQIWKYAAGR
jgi:hypothetical protein